MDCGVPFCQSNHGCPIDNLIPEWNDLVYQGRWRDALDRLHKTNNFPEFTGRTCPAPCEGACVLGITSPPVTIKNIENAIIDRGWDEGWIAAAAARVPHRQEVAIVGSGPSGLAAAAQLNKAGHTVTVYERADRIGGLLMYGIPNMKLDKGVVERRVDLLREEGVKFVTCAHVGRQEDFPAGHMTQIMQERGCEVKFIDPQHLLAEYDAVAPLHRRHQTVRSHRPLPGRDLAGIHYAMDFLTRNTKSLLDGDSDLRLEAHLANGHVGSSTLKPHASSLKPYISAAGLNVIVIGGGDTGADCIGTCPPPRRREHRQLRAARPAAAETRRQQPLARVAAHLPRRLLARRGEGLNGDDPRAYNILTKEFVDDGHGRVKGVHTVEVDWSKPVPGGAPFSEVPGSEKTGPPTSCCWPPASSAPS